MSSGKQITLDTSAFNNNLSAADTTVQKAMDTIDNLSLGGGGGSVLSDLTAAVAGNEIENGNNAQSWRWKLTTDSRIAMRFTEDVASTAGGTSTIVQIDTIAASTAIPLLVKTRGAEVLRAPATGAQILITSGVNGSVTVPNLAIRNSDTGFFMPDGGTISITLGGKRQFTFDNDGIFEVYAAPTQVKFEGYKSNGSIDSPTAIQTSAAVLQITAFGYVGATNEFQEVGRISIEADGSVSDAEFGAAGRMIFETSNGSGAFKEALRFDKNQNVVVTKGLSLGTTATSGFLYIPTMNGVPTGTPDNPSGSDRYPIVYDRSNDDLYIYSFSASAWKKVAMA